MTQAVESYALNPDAELYAALMRAAADAVLTRLNTKIATETAARESADNALNLRVVEVETDVTALQEAVTVLQQSKMDTISLETQFKDWLAQPSQLALLEGSVMTWNGATYSVASVLASLLAKPIIVATRVLSRDADYYPVTMRATLASGQVCVFDRTVETITPADAANGVYERRRYSYSCADFAGQAVTQTLVRDLVPVYSQAEPGMVLFTQPQVVEDTNILFDVTTGFTGKVVLPLSAMDLNADGSIGIPVPPAPAPTPAPAPEPAPAPAPGAAELIALQQAQAAKQSADSDVVTADALADQTEASAAQAVIDRDAAQTTLTEAQAGGDAETIAVAQTAYDDAVSYAAGLNEQAVQQRNHVGTLENIAAAAAQGVIDAQAAYDAAIAG